MNPIYYLCASIATYVILSIALFIIERKWPPTRQKNIIVTIITGLSSVAILNAVVETFKTDHNSDLLPALIIAVLFSFEGLANQLAGLFAKRDTPQKSTSLAEGAQDEDSDKD